MQGPRDQGNEGTKKQGIGEWRSAGEDARTTAGGDAGVTREQSNKDQGTEKPA